MLDTTAWERFSQAISFSARVHQGQFRKDGSTPYAAHPVRVAFVVDRLFCCHDPEVLAAAVLHDVIEDTTTDYEDLEEAFGSNIADWVAALSKDSRLPESQRDATYLNGLMEAAWQTRLIKLADAYDNLMDARHISSSARARLVGRTKSLLEAIEKVAQRPEVISAADQVRQLLQLM